MILKCYGCSKKGNYRENNEDNFLFGDTYMEVNHDDEIICCEYKADKVIMGVFDGLGGEDRGEEASFRAAKILDEYKNNIDFETYFKNTNKEICTLKKKGAAKRVGTTAAIINFEKNYFNIANIGDSRAYIIRNNLIEQLSVDHTVVETMIESGIISREDAAKSPYKNYLSQCLGISEEEMTIEPYISDYEKLMDGDIFVICSDGLSGVLSDEEIKNIVINPNFKKSNIANVLVDKAYECGTKDNTTVIVIYVQQRFVEKIKAVFEK